MAKRRKKDSARSGEQSIDRNAIDALKVVLRDGYVIGGPLLAMYVFDLNWLAENAGEEVQHVLDDLHAYAFGQKASWDPATEECIRQHRRYSLYNPAEMPFEAGRKLKEENLRAVFRNALVRGDDGKIALRDPASPSHANTEARLASEQAMFEELASQAEEAAQPTEDVETTRLENGKPTRKGKNSNGPKGRAR